MEKWIDDNKIRVAPRDVTILDRSGLIRLAKLGLKSAEVELARRGEILAKTNAKPPKHKTQWDVSRAETIDETIV